MAELTVGYVSGLIAIAVFIVRLIIPLAISLVLAGVLRDENTAITWSVAGRAIQSSYWPTILGAESTATRRVRKDIVFLTQLVTLMYILISVASVVTPFGLYEELVPGGSVDVEFEYVKDTSPMGYGTPQRSPLGFSRKCGAFSPVACPGSNTVVITSKKGSSIISDLPYGYNTSIPQSLVDLYSSGTSGNGTTVSNLFDIEWRNYHSEQERQINNGSRFLVGSFRHLQTMLLNDAVEPVEGLLVDTKNGGVGFRHHTLPKEVKHGVEWTEDLLFIEPETECVNTNLTLDFTIGSILKNPASRERTPIESLVLTDRGGFVNLNKTLPYYDRSNMQLNPDLRGRAYMAAWATNALTMHYFNVSNPNPDAFSYMNSAIGKSFQLSSRNADYFFDALTTSTRWDRFLNFGLFTNSSSYKPPPNPFQINSGNFSMVPTLCSGAGGKDLGNITNIAVVCGLIYGAPRRQDGSEQFTFDEGSSWTIPLYSCATAVKATVKSVDLRANGTLGLRSLNVVNLRNKVYKSEQDKPLWGIEDANMTLADAMPLWGLIAPSYEGHRNVSTVRKESLYLSSFAGIAASGLASSVQYLPGVEFYVDALRTAYNIGPSSIALLGGTIIDYSGRTNMAMYAKWQQLSRTENATSKILNLIWTDVSASAVMGTKGVLGPRKSSETGRPVRVAVKQIVRRVKCRLAFAVVSYVVAALCFLVTVAALVFWIMGGTNIATMKRQIRQTSTGRILTAFLYPQGPGLRAKTGDWVPAVGTKYVNLSETPPTGRKVDDEGQDGGSDGSHGAGNENNNVTNAVFVSATDDGMQKAHPR
ncbi:hypothetical protein VFPPC_16830 [Pochonia chlamydosporia 170]|uniref:Uncharacterized protein n=1 Tax=Pochonia chlamydosporia 170 TaxID=1380566 RepID=A0A179F3R3_METCM|nr:hypothetical protein VFPPC_16830 [Pochonia chlamydosporia 170]OAQ60042.2 hypothetical protein VFPPC_16830 [Pochonia chlamydosporia 170]